MTGAIVAIATMSCDEDQRVPRADFRRPTGLAYIERLIRIDCPVGPLLSSERYESLTDAQREATDAVVLETFEGVRAGALVGTLLVADSEAEGVRVQQYLQERSIVGTGTAAEDVLANNTGQIVPGPTVFFPLVLSAPGFPTQVTASKDQMIVSETCTYPERYSVTADGTTQDFVLTPQETSRVVTRTSTRAARGFVLTLEGGAGGGSGSIRIINSRPRPYPARSDAFRQFGVGTIDLGTLEETAGPWIPVDLQTVGYSGCETPTIPADEVTLPGPCDDIGLDTIALLQDPVTADDGRLVFMTIDRARPPMDLGPDNGAFIAPTQIVSVRLPAPSHPEKMLVLDDRILISNAAPNANPGAAGSQESALYEVPYTLVNGRVTVGEVRRIYVGGPTNLIVDGGTLGIFATRIDRPYLVQLVKVGDRWVISNDALDSPFAEQAPPTGQLVLRNSPVLAAHKGRLEQLEQAVTGEGTFSGLREEDFEEDGLAPVLMVAYADGAINFVAGSPARLTTLRGNRITSVRRLEAAVGEVTAPFTDTTTDAVAATGIIGCLPPEFSGVPDQFGSAPACYPTEAAVLDCEDPSVSPQKLPLLRSNTESRRYRVTYRGALFTAESGSGTFDSDSTASVDVSTFNTSSDQITLANAPIEEGDNVFLQAIGTVTSTSDPSVLTSTTVVAQYVLRRVDKSAVLELELTSPEQLLPEGDFDIRWLEIYPSNDDAIYTRVINGRVAEVLQRRSPAINAEDIEYSFRGDLDASIDVRFPGTIGAEIAVTQFSQGRICTQLGECPADFVCTSDEAADNVVRACFARCRRTCEESDPDCVDSRLARPGLEFTVDSTRVAGTSLVANLTGGSLDRLAAPADVVFAFMRASWLISVPGTRALAEVAPVAEGIAVGVVR